MEIREARLRLITALKQIEVRAIRGHALVRPFFRRQESEASVFARQEGRKAHYLAHCRLSEDEYWKLHMFFSPLMVFEGLTEAQVQLCMRLHDELRGEQRLIRDEPLIKLFEAARSQEAMMLGDDFPKVIEQVFRAKMAVKAEMQRSNRFWQKFLCSLSLIEREDFLREWGDRLPFLHDIDLDE